MATADTPLLLEFGPDLFLADGPTVNFYGFPYPTRMVVVRLDNGSAWVWSPIDWSDELLAALKENKLDRVEHVVSPNKIHHVFLKGWQDKFPQATYYAPPGLSKRGVAKDILFDKELDFSDGSTETPSFHQEIAHVIFEGSLFMDEVVFYHDKSKTAIFGDLIQRFPEENMTGWKGWLMRMDGLVGKQGSTPREWRLSFMFGKQKARGALHTVLEEWKPDNLVIAHGECVKDGTATEVIARALSWI